MPFVLTGRPIFSTSLFFVCWFLFNCPKSPTQPELTLAGLTFSAPAAAPGETVTATVQLHAAAGAGGASVSIASGNPAATVPPSVVVAAGSNAATFPIAVSAQAASPGNVLIEARLGGSVVTAAFRIERRSTPPPTKAPLRLASIALDSDDLIGGQDVKGTLTFSRVVEIGDPHLAVEMFVEQNDHVIGVMQAGTRSLRFKLPSEAVGHETDTTVWAWRDSMKEFAAAHMTLLPWPDPVLHSLAPASIPAGAATEVVLEGTALTQLGGTRVNVSGAGVTTSPITVLDSRRIRAVFTVAADAASGSRAVSVTNNSGTTNSVTLAVVYSAPTITSISPASGDVGFNVPVTITGTNFTGGATVAISGSDVTVSGVTVVNTTTITATLQIGQFATGGARSVTVTTAQGTSNAVTFTINP